MQKFDFHVQIFWNPYKGTCSIYSTLWILFAYWRNKRAQLSSLSAVSQKVCTVKLGNKERFDKEQIGIKELFMDYQPFYTINLLLDKELLPV